MLDEEVKETEASETKEESKEKEEQTSKKEKKANKKIEELEFEIEKLKTDVAHWKNEYYKAYADTKNLRSSLEKDHREALKYRVEGFAEELLPILDSFQSVLGKEVEDPNLRNYLIGFNYVYRNLITVLENEGIKEIAPKEGDKFDSATMTAVDTIEAEKENIVTKVYGNGYKLHDRLIRGANVQVSVVKKEEPSKEDSNKEQDNKENLNA